MQLDPISRDPTDAIMTGPLGSWLCFPQCWLQMQMGFSSDTARWSQAAPGPHSTTFETGRRRELHLPSNSTVGIESHCTNLVMSPGWKRLVTSVPHRGVGVHDLFYPNHLDWESGRRSSFQRGKSRYLTRRGGDYWSIQITHCCSLLL